MCFWNQISVGIINQDKQHNTTKPTSKKSTLSHASYKWSMTFSFFVPTSTTNQSNGKDKNCWHIESLYPKVFHNLYMLYLLSVPKNWSQSSPKFFQVIILLESRNCILFIFAHVWHITDNKVKWTLSLLSSIKILNGLLCKLFKISQI